MSFPLGKRSRISEDEGLQVDYINGCGPEVVKRDHEGLQTADFQNVSSKDSYVVESGSVTHLVSEKSISRRPSRKVFLLVGGTIGFLVLLAIILGAVLGSKSAQAAKNHSEGPSTDSNGSNETNSPSRIRSTSGAWNGTALASVYAMNAAFWSFMFYQDYTGALIAGQYNLSTTDGAPFMVGKTIIRTTEGAVKAALGSGIGSTRYYNSKTAHNSFQLVYVAPNGSLCDLWLQDTDIDSSGHVTGVWTEGVISALKFQAPTDNRPSMFMVSSELWLGDVYNNSNNGARLWAGGVDGKLHQYSWKGDGGQWYNEGYEFPESYAYGSAYAMLAGHNEGAFNTTLYTTASDGTLQYRVQSNTGQPQWPVGGTWSEPVSTNAKAAVNTSVAAQWEQAWGDYIFYPTEHGVMGSYKLSLDQPILKQWNKYDNDYEELEIMPGTDMTHDCNSFGCVVHFQKSGNDVCWQYFANGAGVNGCLDL